jgi:hypothetical protein
VSENDRRVFNAVACACGEWDGYIPHTIADHTAIRRLRDAGLVEYVDHAICQTCSSSHEAAAYGLTDAGRAHRRGPGGPGGAVTDEHYRPGDRVEVYTDGLGWEPATVEAPREHTAPGWVRVRHATGLVVERLTKYVRRAAP